MSASSIPGSPGADNISAFIQTLLDDGDAATVRRTLGIAASDGWVDHTTTTWTYASATTFTISGVDLTSTFTKGTRLRLKQGGSYKYFVVIGSSFSTNTTVTITGGTDYTLANASITDNYYSYAASPQGYPATFNWSPTLVGWSGTPTTEAKFFVIGNVCFLNLYVSGTSNSTTTTATIPITAASVNAMQGSGFFSNNGASIFGRWYLNDVSTIKFGISNNSDVWTGSGAKGIGLPGAYYQF